MNVFENSSTPPVNDHSQYSLYGSIWVVAEYYYSLNYLSRPVFRTYDTVFALSKHLCTVQYTYHGLDRWTSEINLALTKWTPCHVIFTFWKKACFSIILRSFQFPSVFGQAAIILVRSFWAIILFFSRFFSKLESAIILVGDHFSGYRLYMNSGWIPSDSESGSSGIGGTTGELTKRIQLIDSCAHKQCLTHWQER